MQQNCLSPARLARNAPRLLFSPRLTRKTVNIAQAIIVTSPQYLPARTAHNATRTARNTRASPLPHHTDTLRAHTHTARRAYNQ